MRISGWLASLLTIAAIQNCMSVPVAFGQAAALQYSVEVTESFRPNTIGLKARLKNVSDEPILVNWHGQLHPQTFIFDIVHKETGRRIPVLQSSYRSPASPQYVSEQRYFVEIAPGETAEREFGIGPGDSLHGILHAPGEYLIHPKLNIIATHVQDRESGANSKVPNAWTGELTANAFSVQAQGVLDVPKGRVPLHGQVLSPEGAPVANAIVQLRYSNAPDAEFNWRTAVLWDNTFTDQDGRFDFPGVPPESDYSLTVHHPDHVTGYLIHDLESFASGVSPIVHLPQSMTLTGRVRTVDGKPLGNVRVNSGTYTNAQGRFTFKTKRNESEAVAISLWRRGMVSVNKRIPFAKALGELDLVMHTQESFSAAGIATFADGMPVANSKIEFKLVNYKELQQPPNYISQVRTTTDENGKFKVVLPDTNEYRAVAIAAEPNDLFDAGMSRKWSCEVAGLKAGSAPLKLEFDNRGRIVLRLFDDGQLKSSQQVAVSCSSPKYGGVAWNRFPGDFRGHIYSGLEPGEYRLTANVEEAGYDEWSASISIPDTDPCRAAAVIKIPKIKLGSVTGRLLLPDGKTPAVGFSLRVGSRGTTKEAVTDSEGRFRVDSLPEGQAFCSIAPVSGMCQEGAVHGFVMDEKVADIGTIRLINEAEEFGWFEPVLSYSDSAAVQGYSLLGVFEQFPYHDGHFGGVPISAMQAQTKLRVRKGKGVAVIDIFGTGRARNVISGGMDLMRPSVLKSMVVNVDIEAGKSLRSELVVPKRSDGRDVTVSWTTEVRPKIVAVIQQSKDIRWFYESQESYLHPLDSEGKVRRQKSLLLNDIPKGTAHIIFNGWTTGSFGILPLSELDTEITFDGERSAQIDVLVKDSTGTPIEVIAATLSAKFQGELIGLGMMRLPDKPTGIRDLGIYSRPAVGQIRASGLGAGSYLLKVRGVNWEHSFDIELQPEESHQISLVVNADGTLAESTSSATASESSGN